MVLAHQLTRTRSFHANGDINAVSDVGLVVEKLIEPMVDVVDNDVRSVPSEASRGDSWFYLSAVPKSVAEDADMLHSRTHLKTTGRKRKNYCVVGQGTGKCLWTPLYQCTERKRNLLYWILR